MHPLTGVYVCIAGAPCHISDVYESMSHFHLKFL